MKETSSKNELSLFKEFESACQESERCLNLASESIQKKHCILECVSPICYQELYEKDQLEEGEIDVRGNSFKGCFIQRSGLTRN